MNKERLVVTGGNGLLGQKLIHLLKDSERYEVHSLAKGPCRLKDGSGFVYHSIDLLDEQALDELIDELRPDAIINTAAMTNVDACELDPSACDRINVWLVGKLIALCERLDIYMVHLSTDFVFSGLKGSVYCEDDPTDPVNYYGLSKLRSEQLMQSSGVRGAILRTILVYGLVDQMDRNNIVLWVKQSLEAGEKIRVVTDQLRMPTYAEDLAEACVLALERKAEGIFNVSSSELMSVYEIALAIAELYGLDSSLIEPISSSDLKLPADRPLKTGFDLSKSAETLGLPLYTFKERLAVFKTQLAERQA